MSDINKEAFKEAEKELLEKKVKEVKGYILETLERIEDKKKDKAKIEEELRILKLDLEDLREGKFERIKERIDKSKVAKEVTVYIHYPVITYPLKESGFRWLDNTAGTYMLNNGNTFYF